MKVLVINPGATSTKIAVFDEDKQVFKKGIDHSAQELDQFDRVIDQADYRQKAILDAVAESGYQLSDFDAVCGRGGLYRAIPSGTYAVSDAVMRDVEQAPYGEHPSNLGAYLAKKLGDMVGIPAFFVDPVCVDEMTEVAHISGFREFRRQSLFHALNQKATARKAAEQMGKRYEDVKLIVCHLGGGVSVAAHDHGRVVDVFNVKDEGAMGLDRGGSLPVNALINYCYSGKSKEEVKRIFGRQSGMFSGLSAPRWWRATKSSPRPTGPWSISWPRILAPWPPCCTLMWTPLSTLRVWPMRSFSATIFPSMSPSSRPLSGCPVRRKCALWLRAPCVCSMESRKPAYIDFVIPK